MAVSKKFRWTNADGDSVEVDIGAESENVTVEGIPLDEVLDSQAEELQDTRQVRLPDSPAARTQNQLMAAVQPEDTVQLHPEER